MRKIYNYCAITDENKFNRNVIENHIDTSHKPVMAVTEVTDNNGFYMGAHMVTIVGYDYNYYYCAFGDENPAAVPKEDLEVTDSKGNMKYKVFFITEKNA